MGRLRSSLSLFFLVAACYGETLVTVGTRRLSIDCVGKAGPHPTVILLAGGGRTAKDWSKVQPEVAKFARVCSYDRAGLGASDKPEHPQDAEEVVDDLHALLQAAGEKAPYLLAGHSIAGVYSRRFQVKFPKEVAALVFVDSSHEEQAWRFREINPAGATPDERAALMGLYTERGKKLEWHTDIPVIVFSRGEPFPVSAQITQEQSVQMTRLWHELHQDLAQRSSHGQYRRAEKSGHYIHLDQPDLVIQAIRELDVR